MSSNNNATIWLRNLLFDLLNYVIQIFIPIQMRRPFVTPSGMDNTLSLFPNFITGGASPSC